jgi:hypothetical protein
MTTERRVYTRTIFLPLPPHESFLFFDPDGERRYVEGWDPEVFYRPADGWAGAAFRTNAAGDETYWLVADYDSAVGSVRYARIAPATRAGFVTVVCEAAPSGSSVTVTYELTALTVAGETMLQELTEARYRAMINGWARDIGKALATLG